MSITTHPDNRGVCYEPRFNQYESPRIHMKTRQVTIEEIDQLFLEWFDYINASALYRQALREEMNVRDIDPHEFRDLLERAQGGDIRSTKSSKKRTD